MSHWMRGLVAIGAVALLATVGWLWVDDQSLIKQHAQQLADLPAANAALAPLTRLALFAIVTPSLLLGFFMLLQAWKLFGAYGRGQVFGPEAVGPVRRLAWALVATAALRPLSNTLSTLVLTWHSPPGRRMLVLGVSSDDYLCLMFGVLLLAMAWAMTEASRLEQDNAGFV